MTLVEGIKKAEAERKSKVVIVNDCGDKWLFGFEDDQNKMDGLMLFVHKKKGNVKYILPSFLAEALLDGEITCTPVDLPKEDA